MIVWRIDKSTIRPNPNAGRTEYLIPGRRWTDEKGVQHTQFQHLFSMHPEGKHRYAREPLQVTCVHCSSSFPAEELANDVMDDGDGGETFNGQVCPCCNAWDCLGDELHYETVEEALARA